MTLRHMIGFAWRFRLTVAEATLGGKQNYELLIAMVNVPPAADQAQAPCPT